MLAYRYECFEGVKYYNDQMLLANTASTHYHFAVDMGVNLGSIRFCQYENPHAGVYCLCHAQLQYWLERGNPYIYESTAYGPLESAVTFNMMHAFEIVKPHPANIHFLHGDKRR
jgi:hypothetical protein